MRGRNFTIYVVTTGDVSGLSYPPQAHLTNRMKPTNVQSKRSPARPTKAGQMAR